MTQTILPHPAPEGLQRARGRAEVVMRAEGGRNRLERLYQQGCAKAILPRSHARLPEAVLVNTSGGITGGDRLDYAMTAGDGAGLVVTTQAAERIYRAASGVGQIATRLTLGAGAELAWLPQETIVFEGGAVERTLDVEMAPDAQFTALESMVLGRAAMGERVTVGHISDQWRIRRGGRLVHAEALRASGDLAAATASPATLGGARAFATLVHAAPGAAERIDAVRALLPEGPAVRAAATTKPDLLILRFISRDAAPLRAALIRFLTAFRQDALPRVWSL